MNTTEVMSLIFKLLAPVVADLFAYLMGQTDHKPAILLTLPDHLQAEAALARAKLRVRT